MKIHVGDLVKIVNVPLEPNPLKNKDVTPRLNSALNGKVYEVVDFTEGREFPVVHVPGYGNVTIFHQGMYELQLATTGNFIQLRFIGDVVCRNNGLSVDGVYEVTGVTRVGNLEIKNSNNTTVTLPRRYAKLLASTPINYIKEVVSHG